jgi:hypothetical protein
VEDDPASDPVNFTLAPEEDGRGFVGEVFDLDISLPIAWISAWRLDSADANALFSF